MINNYIRVLTQYAVFTGRARRSEYWLFFLANIIIGFILGFIEGLVVVTTGVFAANENSVLADLYSLVVLVPSIAVGVRRLHDSNKSGWWLLVPLYNLYLLIRKGTNGPNRFGNDPLNPDAVTPMPEATPVTTAPETTETEQK